MMNDIEPPPGSVVSERLPPPIFTTAEQRAAIVATCAGARTLEEISARAGVRIFRTRLPEHAPAVLLGRDLLCSPGASCRVVLVGLAAALLRSCGWTWSR